MENRNIALDGLRGFSMLLVFSWHCLLLDTTTFADRIYIYLNHHFWVGMHFFFALSGFLITGILLDSKGKARYWSNFFARRFLRIFPLYYCVLVICFFVLPHFPNHKSDRLNSVTADEWSYWLYLCNYTIGQHGWRHPIADVAWSLAVEEQFYIFWPFIVAALPIKRLFQLLLVIPVLALCYRTSLVYRDALDITIYVSTLGRFDAISAGALVAVLYRYPTRWGTWVVGNARRLLIASFLVTAPLLMRVNGDYDARSVQILGHGLVAIFAGLLILNLTSENRPRRFVAFFETKLFCLVGKYSYGFYLFHLPLRAMIRDAVFRPSDTMMFFGSHLPGQIVFVVVSGAFVLAVSALSFHLFESPILGLKRYFEYRKDSPHEEPIKNAA